MDVGEGTLSDYPIETQLKLIYDATREPGKKKQLIFIFHGPVFVSNMSNISNNDMQRG